MCIFILEKTLDDVNEEEESSNNSFFDVNGLFEDQPTHCPQKPGSGVSYTPTPIAELKKRHIPVTTAPSVNPSLRRRSEYDISSSKRLKAEYVPALVASTHVKNVGATDSGNFYSLDSDEPHVYKATKIISNDSNQTHSSEVVDNELSLNITSLDDSVGEIDFNLVTDELSFIDEILKEFSGNKSDDDTPDDLDRTNIIELSKESKPNEHSKHDSVQELKNTSDKENKYSLKKKDNKPSSVQTTHKEPKINSDSNPPLNKDSSSRNTKNIKQHNSSHRTSEDNISKTKHRRKTDESEAEATTKKDVRDKLKYKTDHTIKTHALNHSSHSSKHKHRDSSSSSKKHKKDKSSNDRTHKVIEINSETFSKKSDHKSSSSKTNKNAKSSSAQKEIKCQDSKKNKDESKTKQRSSGHKTTVKDNKESILSKHRDDPKHKHRDKVKSRSSSDQVPKRKSSTEKGAPQRLLEDKKTKFFQVSSKFRIYLQAKILKVNLKLNAEFLVSFFM